MMMNYLVDQPVKPVVETNEQLINEISQQIYQSFEQLQQSLSANSQLSPKSILDNIKTVFNNLNNREYFNCGDVVNMFEIILKNYLNLLDTNEFIEVIVKQYACENNIVFSIFFDLFIQEDVLNFVSKMSLKIRQQMYYRILDQIGSSQRINSFLKNELSLPSNDDQSNRIIRNFCGFVLILVLKLLNNLNIKLLDIEIRKYQNTVFIPLLTFLDENFTKNQSTENDMLIIAILEFLNIITNQTLTIPIFINSKYPEACLYWLSFASLNPYEYAQVLKILYNISRHDQGVVCLNEHECYSILTQFNKKVLNAHIGFILDKTTCEELQLIYFMTVVLISEPSDLIVESTHWFLTYRLLPEIFDCIRLRTLRLRKFHTAQLIIVLMKLVINDEFIEFISTNDPFKLLNYVYNVLNFFLHCVRIERFDDNFLTLDVLTIIALANILWSISFHDQYKNNLIENIYILNKLKDFDSSEIMEKILPYIYLPRHMSPLRKTIDGIWHNLNPLLSFNTESLTPTKSTCSLMISYSHNNVNICRQIYDLLSTMPELSINIDFNNSKYLWKDISDTIQQADLVVFLISKDFFNSKSCRQEFTYVIDTLSKPFIAVFIDPDYEAAGWIKDRLDEPDCIRFEENNSDKLISMIKESLSLDENIEKNVIDIQKWNENDVKQWFQSRNIMLELHEFYQFQNGFELLLYAEALLGFTWTKEYERIRTRFAERFKQQELYLSPHEFLKFINALKHLKSRIANSI